MTINTKTHFLKKLRNGPVISVDKQLLRWRKQNLNRALERSMDALRFIKKEQKKESKPKKYLNLFGGDEE